MIIIKDKHNCCGCAACVQACPRKCITFNEDKYGFRYPIVNQSLCIQCNLCEKVCPFINQSQSSKPLITYAAINPNEGKRMKSSSGGIFIMLAEEIINEGGVVFGAQYDKKWEVQHGYTTIKEELSNFQGSKYIQSRIGNSYLQVKEFLKDGRKVLFTGTPCQIMGLKKYLQKEYNNLITVDIVCHGIPSPLIWRTYLNSIISKKNISYKEITDISFRAKIDGWKNYSFVLWNKNNTMTNNKILYKENVSKNLYMNLYTKDLCLRPSCYNCPAKCGKSLSDITLADYWGINHYYPQFDDDKGTSLVLIHSEKGEIIFKKIKAQIIETSYNKALIGNPFIEKNAIENEYVSIFWESFFNKEFQEVNPILKHFRIPIKDKIISNIKRYLWGITPSIIKVYYKSILKK